MNKKIRFSMLAALSTASLLITSIGPAAAADNSPGTACKKLGASATSGSMSVECTKVANKLVWAKVIIRTLPGADASMVEELASLKAQVETLMSSVLSLTQRLAESDAKLTSISGKAGTGSQTSSSSEKCTAGGSCAIGSTGPGGGIVFYDAGSQKSWGRYLEFAPEGWSGNKTDPTAPWCNITTVNFAETINDATQKASVGTEIGKGRANSKLMSIGCKTGAGILAMAYKGGGKDDWFLPSRAELNELCKFARNQPTGNPISDCTPDGVLNGGFASKNYWSSSEEAAKTNSGQNFGEGFVLGGYSKAALFYVRPVRAF